MDTTAVTVISETAEAVPLYPPFGSRRFKHGIMVIMSHQSVWNNNNAQQCTARGQNTIFDLPFVFFFGRWMEKYCHIAIEKSPLHCVHHLPTKLLCRFRSISAISCRLGNAHSKHLQMQALQLEPRSSIPRATRPSSILCRHRFPCALPSCNLLDPNGTALREIEFGCMFSF